MNILIIGTGYVGATTAMVFAEIGWQVTGLDIDAGKIERLKKGQLHFHEPGLEDLIAKHVRSGRLRFTTDKETAMKEHDVIFFALGPPRCRMEAQTSAILSKRPRISGIP